MDILLVDDNHLMQQVLSRFIDALGHHVQMVETASEALELAQQQRFGLLLIDQRLPDHDGPEALKLLRQIPGYDTVPAIGISGMGMEQERLTRAAGFDAFLSKPIAFDELRVLLERYNGLMAHAMGANGTN